MIHCMHIPPISKTYSLAFFVFSNAHIQTGASGESRKPDGAVNDSDDEYFDAHDAPDDQYISPSISISTIEGDPPEIEEDKDYYEVDDTEGIISGCEVQIKPVCNRKP